MSDENLNARPLELSDSNNNNNKPGSVTTMGMLSEKELLSSTGTSGSSSVRCVRFQSHIPQWRTEAHSKRHKKSSGGDMSAWWKWKHGKWAPTNCRQRHASVYRFPDVCTPPCESPPCVDLDEKVQDKKVEPVKKGKWCAACMREVFEPYSLPCGHTFCKRCLTGVHHVVKAEFPHVIPDPRTVMFCPMAACRDPARCMDCTKVTSVRPFINGDFRFHQARPEDKVELRKAEVKGNASKHEGKVNSPQEMMDIVHQKVHRESLLQTFNLEPND